MKTGHHIPRVTALQSHDDGARNVLGEHPGLKCQNIFLDRAERASILRGAKCTAPSGAWPGHGTEAGEVCYPAYGAGHATVAAARVTVLKAFYYEDVSLADLGASVFIPKEDGTELVELTKGKTRSQGK
jgi:hypothetical protein